MRNLGYKSRWLPRNWLNPALFWGGGKTTNRDSISVYIFSAHFDYVSRMRILALEKPWVYKSQWVSCVLGLSDADSYALSLYVGLVRVQVV